MEILFEPSSIVILMLKSSKLKFSDPHEKNGICTRYVEIRVKIWFEQKCIVNLMLKSLKLKLRDPFIKIDGYSSIG